MILTKQEQQAVEETKETLVHWINYYGAKLEEGLKYALWLVITVPINQLEIDNLIKETKAEGYFEGKVCGKQQVIVFYVNTIK
jgi:hypothetical protein